MRDIGGVRQFGGGGLILGLALTCLAGFSSPLAVNRHSVGVATSSESGIPIFAAGFEGAASPQCIENGLDLDDDGDGLLDVRCIEHAGSPDPKTTASPLDPTVPADFAEAIEFIYDSPKPVQHGVMPGTFRDYRVAVLRGKVEDAAGEPFEGVLVRALDHPEYGYTYTRADGIFDLVIPLTSGPKVGRVETRMSLGEACIARFAGLRCGG